MQDVAGEQWVTGWACKGAEARAQTGHRSGGQVQLVHAAVCGCVTPACMCDAMQCQALKFSGCSFSVYESSISGIIINILLWIFNT